MTDIISSNSFPIKLANGGAIENDAIPYEGWGRQPGKWYEVIQLNDDGSEANRQQWAIPKVSDKQERPSSEGNCLSTH